MLENYVNENNEEYINELKAQIEEINLINKRKKNEGKMTERRQIILLWTCYDDIVHKLKNEHH
jgi:hypothetical protein